MQWDAYVNSHIPCIINHGWNTETDLDVLYIETTLMDTLLENDFF